MKLLAALAFLVACSSNPKPNPNPPPGGGSGDGTPAQSETSCQTDADCVAVETQCCDHCNGGKAEAFNKAFADKHRPTGCEGIACTQLACGPAIAKCDSGTCTVEIGKL